MIKKDLKELEKNTIIYVFETNRKVPYLKLTEKDTNSTSCELIRLKAVENTKDTIQDVIYSFSNTSQKPIYFGSVLDNYCQLVFINRVNNIKKYLIYNNLSEGIRRQIYIPNVFQILQLKQEQKILDKNDGTKGTYYIRNTYSKDPDNFLYVNDNGETINSLEGVTKREVRPILCLQGNTQIVENDNKEYYLFGGE